MTPNTQITQDNAGLLKAGDVVRHDKYGLAKVRVVYPESTISYRLISNPSSGGGDDLSRFTYIGPALSPPAEGEQCDGCDTSGRCTYVGSACTHTPAPVDWERVGPKLVEAVWSLIEHFERVDAHDLSKAVIAQAQRTVLAAQPERQS